jgi:hypothetical protein
MTFAKLRAMRLPRPRFTMRAMMIAVAIIGIVMGAEVMRRRSKAFRERADFHEGRRISVLSMENDCKSWEVKLREEFATMVWFLDETTRPMELGERIKDLRQDQEELRRMAAWQSRMASKYNHAAAHPWLTVEADPPPLPKMRFVREMEELEKAINSVLNKSTPMKSLP